MLRGFDSKIPGPNPGLKDELTSWVSLKLQKKFKVWLFPKAEAALLTEMGGIQCYWFFSGKKAQQNNRKSQIFEVGSSRK